MKLNVKKVIPSLRIHTIINGSLIASAGYNIYQSKDNGENWEFCNPLPIGPTSSFLSKNRLISRLFRVGISQIVDLYRDSVLIYCDRGLYLTDFGFSSFELVDLPSRSLQLLDNNICVTPTYIYFTEYLFNHKREKVNVFRGKNGLDWELIYSFPQKSIKHLHVLQYDAKINKLWFSSGDADHECILGFVDLDFSELNIIGKGGQQWRSLEFLFTDADILWGMDTPKIRSKLMSYSRKEERITEIFEFGGPIYNIKQYNKGYIIATANECNGNGSCNCAELWYSSDLLNWTNCISYQKDKYPYFLGFGRLILSRKMKDDLLFSGSALNGIDNKLIISNIEL